jgi:S-adenosylmethionine hydrolase
MPIITLTTDFGLKDHFVGAIKGHIYKELPEATIVDISHQISPFHIQECAYLLKNAYKAFPEGSIHIVGVDSEKTSENTHLAVLVDNHYFITADNGVISLIIEEVNPDKIVEIQLPNLTEDSFPVLGVFVQVACHLARGGTLEVIGKPFSDIRAIKELTPSVTNNGNTILGSVLYIDNYGNVVSNTWTTVHHAGFRADDRMILFLPLFHVFGQNFIMNATFLACASLVLHRRFVPDQVLASIARDRVTMFFAVPTIYIALLNMGLNPADLASIRYEFSAAATMPQEISTRWTERFGRPVYEGYGLTECSPFACYNHDLIHKVGSVGTPVENFEIKIMDENDRELPLGEWGEICIQGPGVMQGYWNKPEETAQALRNGWLHSGDIGTMDEEGFVFIVDRVKDMINVAGLKIWPAEVEQCLYRHPAIMEVAVFGIPHAEKGEIVKAAIILKADTHATVEEIRDYCRDHLAVYKVPSEVVFLDDLPKSATGKILKRILRDNG